MRIDRRRWVTPILLLVAAAGPAVADESEAELAMKLQNPIASLVSVPIQSNWDFGIGPEDAMRYVANVQPVIPFSLTSDWNLITRTILPIVHAESPVAGGREATGIGDILQSFFFSPKEPVAGWIVGGGPALLYPSATDRLLGGEKWAAGPTAVALRQRGGWTYGMLANHLWSFAGTSRRQHVSRTFLQPFLSYTTKTHTSFTFNVETTYDWANDQGTVPLNWMVSQLLRVGTLPLSLQFGPRWYAERPDGGPEWGLRFAVTFLFPK